MTMDSFCGLAIKTDIYNGVHIDLSALETGDQQDGTNCTVDQFDVTLKDSLNYWVGKGIRCVWFRVPTSQSHFIAVLTKHNFKFHHAKGDYAMLIKWIKEDEEIKAPNYAHSMLGVGGLVYNPLTKKVLLIQEKTSIVRIWKFPGGYAEPGEHIFETAIREVFEETGLKCQFHSLLTFRHGHRGAFGCSDVYFVCLLHPIDPANCELKKCDIEIEECRWFDLDEALDKLDQTNFNKYVFERFIGQFDYPSSELSNNAISKGHTINSEVIHSRYAHFERMERVYSLGPISPFSEK